MDEQLNDSDFDVILSSLKHYKTNIQNYSEYPSYEFKQQQLERVDNAMRKIKALSQKLSREQS
jgi:wobble nucleotide-excising tRNase